MQSYAIEPEIEYSAIPGVDCVINPFRVVDVASPVTGVIETIDVERSQQVTRGQIVARLQADVERSNVELARFRANIKSEIKFEQVNLNFDKRRKKRIDSLHQQQVVSIENTEEAKREEGLSHWKLKQARELLDVRKLELKRAEDQLQQKIIRAPFGGFILDTYKDVGEYVEDKPILRLAQLDPLVVEAIVPMENFGEVKVGLLAEVVPEVLSNKKLRAKVTIVDRIGDTASNTFGVRLVMSNPDHRIPAGLKCVLKFLKKTEEQVDESMQNAIIEQPDNLHAGHIKRQQNNAKANDVESINPNNSDLNSINYLASINNEPASLETKKPDNDEALQVKESDRKNESGFFVITPQEVTSQKTQKLLNKLRTAGINDLLRMDHGPYQGQIMLGYYIQRNAAEKRQLILKKLGFTSNIQKRE